MGDQTGSRFYRIRDGFYNICFQFYRIPGGFYNICPQIYRTSPRFYRIRGGFYNISLRFCKIRRGFYRTSPGFWNGAVVLGLSILVILANANIVEAEPEEGNNAIRLVSWSSSPSQMKTDIAPIFTVLRHADWGITPDNKTYLGVRFQF